MTPLNTPAPADFFLLTWLWFIIDASPCADSALACRVAFESFFSFLLGKFACYMWEKHTTDTGQSFGKDLGAARSRLGSAHDVMPRVVVVVIVIVVVVVQIPASREAELGRHVV